MLATQNPIEQEGTYPLPEAQLDRFMLELRVGYPSRTRGGGDRRADHRRRGPGRSSRCSTPQTVRAMQDAGAPDPGVPAADPRRGDAGPDDPARRSRGARPFIREYVEWGAGPRASQYLVLGAKARAALAGRPMADLDDVRAVALSVLRHRVVTNFAAEAAGRTSDDLVRELVSGGGWAG